MMEGLRTIAVAVSMFMIIMGFGLSPYDLDYSKTVGKAVNAFVWCAVIFLVIYLAFELYWLWTNPNWYDLRTFNK